MSTVAIHEAAHCAIGLLVGKRVEYIEKTTGIVHLGEQAGYASVDLGEGLGRERLQIALAGYMAAGGRPNWPPDWSAAFETELEGLNLIMMTLWLERDEYDLLVEQTRHLLDRPDVRQFIAVLSRALDKVPRIYEPEILAIAEAVNFHPEPEGVPA